MGTNQFTTEDKEFLGKYQELYTTAQQGYVRHLDRDVLQQYENIYKRVLDPKFVLCYHCGDDRVNVVLRLHRAYDKQQSDAADLAAIEAESQGEPLTGTILQAYNAAMEVINQGTDVKTVANEFKRVWEAATADQRQSAFSFLTQIGDYPVESLLLLAGDPEPPQTPAPPPAKAAEGEKPKNKGGRPPKQKPEQTPPTDQPNQQ